MRDDWRSHARMSSRTACGRSPWPATSPTTTRCGGWSPTPPTSAGHAV